MLLTIRDLSSQLQIKASTLYSWAAQGKIPCRKIHGLLRFETEEIEQWLASFAKTPLASPSSPFAPQRATIDIDRLIATAKRDVYTRRHGETISPSPTRKEEANGAR